MLSHPLKLVRLSGNLRSLALSAQTDLLPPSGLMHVVCPRYLHASRTRLFLFFPRRKHYLDCYAVCRGDFPLACVEVRLLRAVLGCCFRATQTHLFHLFSPLGSSVFTLGLKSESTPEVNWRWSIFWETGAKAEKRRLNVCGFLYGASE